MIITIRCEILYKLIIYGFWKAARPVLVCQTTYVVYITARHGDTPFDMLHYFLCQETRSPNTRFHLVKNYDILFLSRQTSLAASSHCISAE